MLKNPSNDLQMITPMRREEYRIAITNYNKQFNWRTEISEAFRTPLELLNYLGLEDSEICTKTDSEQEFKMLVPRSFAAKMKAGDPNDPLLKQVLPTYEERETEEEFLKDPLQEWPDSQASKGLLQKYKGRALLMPTAACAINCRYCFRRHFPHQPLDKKSLHNTLEKIRLDQTLEEIILSGGDPLILRDEFLFSLIDELASMPHVKRIRIHTRIPTVLPSRITESFINKVRGYQTKIVMVTHINHPNELDVETGNVLRKLRQAGLTLLNQTVLLKAVNDRAEILVELSEKLFSQGILPYYLHLSDKVEGTRHLCVTSETARQVFSDMLKELPGYLVPRLVVEEPGKSSKTLIV